MSRSPLAFRNLVFGVVALVGSLMVLCVVTFDALLRRSQGQEQALALAGAQELANARFTTAIARAYENATDLERGLLGYRATRSPAFLSPYEKAITERAVILDQLVRAASDDHERDIARRIGRRVDAWTAEIARPLVEDSSFEGGAGAERHRLFLERGRLRMEAVQSDLSLLLGRVAARQPAIGHPPERLPAWARALNVATGTLAIGLLGLMMLLTRSRLERPLAVLTAHIEKMSAGELDPVEAGGVREAQDLARAISRTALALADRRDREGRYRDLLQKLSATWDVPSAAAAALEVLCTRYGAIGGIVWVARGSDLPLELVLTRAIDVTSVPSAGDPLACEARLGRRPIRLALDGEARGFTVRTAFTEAVPVSILAAPLLSDELIVGVIELAFGGVCPADDSELAIALGQIAIVLESALSTEHTGVLAYQLEQQQARLTAVFDALATPAFYLDSAGHIGMCNPAAITLLGHLEGSTLADVKTRLQLSLPDGRAPAYDTAIERALTEGVALRGEPRSLTDVSGRRRMVHLSVVPLRPGGAIAGGVVTMTDMTEAHSLRAALADANDELSARNEDLVAQQSELRTRSEEMRAQSEELSAQRTQLAQRNTELSRASQMKSEFLASMSHELRTPLNAVIGFSDILLAEAASERPLSPQQRAYVSDIETSGRQLLLLINEVLDLSKVEAGCIDLRITRTPLAPPLAEALSAVRRMAAQRHISIHDRASSLAVHAAADPDRLRQVVLNLLSNAVKFTPDGGSVTVSAGTIGDQVVIQVSDSGIGIAAADLSRLFQPFTQIDSGLARRYPGTGLGLVICKRLVEAMGGQISVESTPGCGSSFRFTLPRADTDTPLVPSRESRPLLPDRRRTVLVVEEAEVGQRIIEATLRRGGYAVAVAHGAADAMARLDDLDPIAVVVDLGPAGTSSAGLIDQLRGNPRFQALPIAVLVNRALTVEENASLARGAHAVFQKGAIMPSEFLAGISQLERGAAPEKPPVGASTGNRPRLLLVDDNEINRRVIRAMLSSLSCELHEAADAAAAIRLAGTIRPAAILMDVQMPEMDGLDATRLLRQSPETQSIPVIAVTAHAMPGDAERALAAGCVAHVAKPVSRNALIRAIDAAIGSVEN